MRHDPERAFLLQPRRAFVAQQSAADFAGIVAHLRADDLKAFWVL
jgi:hypothetical protein